MLAICLTLLAIMLTSIAYLVAVRGLFFIVLVSSVVSIVSVLFYLIVSAPDIALTEMAISACISTIFYIFTLIYISSQKAIDKKKAIDQQVKKKILVLLIMLPFIFVIYELILLLPKVSLFFDFTLSGSLYVKDAMKDFGIPSVVTTIIAGYRALDTMFETIVILTTSFVLKNIFSSKQD